MSPSPMFQLDEAGLPRCFRRGAGKSRGLICSRKAHQVELVYEPHNHAGRFEFSASPRSSVINIHQGSRSKVAHALCIPQSELESLMFGLTMASIEGGRKGTPSRSRLTLVGN